MANTFTVTPIGVGWTRFEARLTALQVGAREAARARFLIGSSLPYASHWIEEGWREDPRYGTVRVQYRKPAATYFMKGAADTFGGRVAQRRPSEDTTGAVFNALTLQGIAEDVADSMRQILNAEVYSAPVPTTNGRARWQRTHALYNSIKAYRA